MPNFDFRIVSVCMFQFSGRMYYTVQTNDGGTIVYDDYAKLPDMVVKWMKARNERDYTCSGTVIYDKPLQVSVTFGGGADG